MNKYLLPSFIILLLVYTGFIVFKKDKLLESIDNPKYQEYIQEYKNTVDKKVQQLIEKNEELENFNLDYKITRGCPKRALVT